MTVNEIIRANEDIEPEDKVMILLNVDG